VSMVVRRDFPPILVAPAKAGAHGRALRGWAPAFAGATNRNYSARPLNSPVTVET
jgi:hypothetical protein